MNAKGIARALGATTRRPDPPDDDRLVVHESLDRAGIFRAVLESIRDAVFVVRPEGRMILLANPAVGRVFGYDPEALVGLSTRVLYVCDEDFFAFGDEAETALELNGPFRGEQRFQRADGTTFIAEVTTAPIKTGAWSDGVVSLIRDVTEERESEAARDRLMGELAERVKELRGIHDTATVLADQQSRIEEVLQKVATRLPEAWHYPDDTAVRIRYGDVDVSSDGYRETPWLQTAEFFGRGRRIGYLTACRLGTKPEEPDARFLPEEEDLIRSLAFLIGSYIQSREHRAQLERERDRFTRLFLTGPVAMALTRPDDGEFIDVNEHWAELTGYSRDELVGRTALEVGLWQEPADREALREELNREGTVRGIPLHYRWRGRSPRVGLASVQLIEMDGQLLWFTTILDRTNEARLEEEQARLEEQKQALLRLGALGDLAGGIAHDFNNLLLPVLINTELSLPDATGELRARLAEIREAALRGRELTRKLLAFGRRVDVRKKSVRVTDMVISSETILRRMTPEGIRLETDLSPDAKPVSADPLLLEQVLLNLVLNAAEATADGGRITVRVRTERLGEEEAAALAETGPDFDRVEPGEYTYLEVVDNGIGIAPELRERIFEPFFTTKDETSGTGLGLASVLGIVKQHGGHIGLISEVGWGSEFRIGLPAESDEAPLDAPTDRSAEQEPADVTRHILVVEDDDAVRRVTVRALEAFGFSVTAAADPRDALELIESGIDIDMVLSDMVMPGMTGLELCDAIRERMPDIPVLFVSGYSTDVLSKHGVDRSSVRVLEKPFPPDALAQAVLETLAEGR